MPKKKVSYKNPKKKNQKKNLYKHKSLPRSHSETKKKGWGNRPSIDEYFGLEAELYARSNWMKRNQQKTARYAVELLKSNQFFQKNSFNLDVKDEIPNGSDSSVIGKNIQSKNPVEYPCISLDLGCGTGYSSHILAENFARVLGVDFSRDMLTFTSLNHPNTSIHFIQADLRALPFREHLFSVAISISAFNFVSEGAREKSTVKKQIRKAFSDLRWCLQNYGKVVIEFYPTPLEEMFFMQVLKELNFQGGLLRNDPDTRKEKKYLVLQK